MKKFIFSIFFFPIVIFFFNVPIALGRTVIDQYATSNRNSAYSFEQNGANGDYSLITQCFNVTATTEPLDSADMYVKRTGAYSGNTYVYIYATTGTYGTSCTKTGSALATSDVVNGSTYLGSWSNVTYTFTGANKITLSAGHYAIVLDSTSGNGDNNTIYLESGIDNSTPDHGGNFSYSTDHSTMTTVSGSDGIFALYSDDPATVSETFATSTLEQTQTNINFAIIFMFASIFLALTFFK